MQWFGDADFVVPLAGASCQLVDEVTCFRSRGGKLLAACVSGSAPKMIPSFQ
jgi:hypothetical protein